MSKVGLHDPFEHFQHNLWPKEGLGVKLTTRSWESPRFPCVQVACNKISTRATTLLHTSSQSEVCIESYAPSKSRESQLWEFQDSHLGVLKQNAIWMPVPWPCIKYTIKGMVVASPKSGPW